MGHAVVAGAIGLALRRLEPAVGEFAAPRIAERPSADEIVDFVELHFSHLSDLGLGDSHLLELGEALRGKTGSGNHPG